MKTWFITGVSRGLGLAIAKAALAEGDRVIGTVRGEPPPLTGDGGQLHIVKADMSDPLSIATVVRDAFELAGKIDVIVNNAGYGLLGAVEGSTDEELTNLFAVDVFAPVRIVRAALPYLRSQRSGHIINITSIAGRAPSVGAALYSAAKHALEGFSASLAPEVAPLGIKVTAVAPGQFRTDFLAAGSIRMSRGESAAYGESVGKTISALEEVNRHQLGDPDRAARVILDVARADDPPVHLLLGSDALKRSRSKIDAVLEEMAAWERWTVSTDFE
ncbi:SDR family NAD(P)-dependent oxidoreductase [Shinella sp. BYT-45]|uniref:SDR family NAD(P)-dependent oxidoreductase n=1 Tax=Shinella sp. BYT-45 TaxID=3377377 RepID=UPI0039810DC1